MASRPFDAGAGEATQGPRTAIWRFAGVTVDRYAHTALQRFGQVGRVAQVLARDHVHHAGDVRFLCSARFPARRQAGHHNGVQLLPADAAGAAVSSGLLTRHSAASATVAVAARRAFGQGTGAGRYGHGIGPRGIRSSWLHQSVGHRQYIKDRGVGCGRRGLEMLQRTPGFMAGKNRSMRVANRCAQGANSFLAPSNEATIAASRFLKHWFT